MPGIIQLLPDHVSNQIAAGEVVQRPAAAVKELMENAVDAGATQIKVVVKDAGKTLVQVSDNGCGMNETDARMCFERHATSKIRKAEDLFRIFTKGFRGEALASIAAVAQVELVTRRAEDETGTHIVINASKIEVQEPIAVGPGTTFQMKNLFYNIPARRNFLKTESVELRHIIEEFQRVALVHPAIEFSLTHNGEEIFHLMPGNLRQRLVHVFGKAQNEKLVPVDSESGIIKITGFIVKPQFAKRSRGEQYFFVNHRFIKSSYLHHAVQSAYLNLIGADQFPGYFLYLEVAPEKIDVNIHPSKVEVKFEDERSVYMMLQAAVRQSLGKFNIAPSLDFTEDHSISIDPLIKSNKPLVAPTIKVNPSYNPFENDTSFHSTSGNKQQSESLLKSLEEIRFSVGNKDEGGKQETLIETLQQTGMVKLFGPYCLVAFDSTCMILHMRRALECVHYYRIQHALALGNFASQKLLFPELYTIAETDLPLWNQSGDVLKKLGLEYQYTGNNQWEITGVPAGMDDVVAVNDLLDDLMDTLRTTGQADKNVLTSKLASRMAHKISLSAKDISISDGLLEELLSTPSPTHTPGGLVTFIYLTKEELENKFNR
ncbi:MAG: DNA mismatch repair endonuclease MutL [Flavobacteriales bacterium]